MASIVGRAAFRATPRLRAYSERESSKSAMAREAKKNPELYVLLNPSRNPSLLTFAQVLFGVMAGVFGAAGYYFCTLLLGRVLCANADPW
jgi:hypothetical protein